MSSHWNHDNDVVDDYNDDDVLRNAIAARSTLNRFLRFPPTRVATSVTSFVICPTTGGAHYRERERQMCPTCACCARSTDHVAESISRLR